jgi:hypothetical protein
MLHRMEEILKKGGSPSSNLSWACDWAVAVSMAAVLLTGCVSKSTAEARARAAFLAGQQQAASVARETQLQGPTVTVVGEVRNSLIHWTIDLTLAKAVIAAGFYGRTDPIEISIQRDGKEIQCEPKRLLSGEDLLLQPNDVIFLRQ